MMIIAKSSAIVLDERVVLLVSFAQKRNRALWAIGLAMVVTELRSNIHQPIIKMRGG